MIPDQGTQPNSLVAVNDAIDEYYRKQILPFAKAFDLPLNADTQTIAIPADIVWGSIPLYNPDLNSTDIPHEGILSPLLTVAHASLDFDFNHITPGGDPRDGIVINQVTECSLFDMVDITRQVMANAFIPMYLDLVSAWNSSDSSSLSKRGQDLIKFLEDLDTILLTNPNFRLSSWIKSARAWADGDDDQSSFLEYNFRNQITVWGPNGEIADYASKQWSGLVSTFYVPRWRIFIQYLEYTPPASFNATEVTNQLLDFEPNMATRDLG